MYPITLSFATYFANASDAPVRTALVVFIGLVAVFTIVCIFITYQKGFQFFTVFPLVFLSLILGDYSVLKKFGKEIELRKVDV